MGILDKGVIECEVTMPALHYIVFFTLQSCDIYLFIHCVGKSLYIWTEDLLIQFIILPSQCGVYGLHGSAPTWRA